MKNPMNSRLPKQIKERMHISFEMLAKCNAERKQRARDIQRSRSIAENELLGSGTLQHLQNIVEQFIPRDEVEQLRRNESEAWNSVQMLRIIYGNEVIDTISPVMAQILEEELQRDSANANRLARDPQRLFELARIRQVIGNANRGILEV